jgi:ParB/RepB/Spo0J family partition protein
MRTESLYEGMAELIEDIRVNGLKQPIGVTECEDGTFAIRWGMRRSIAFREMGKEMIPAMVHQPNEGDADLDMATENLQRTQLNDIEEARYYARYITEKHISQRECASRHHISPSRVSRLLALLEGDTDVQEALTLNKITVAQATEINLFRDELGRKQALKWACENGMTATSLRVWREQRERTGTDLQMEEVQRIIAANPTIDYRSNVRCHMHGDWVPLEHAPLRAICEQCWALVGEVMEWYKQALEQQQQQSQTVKEG